MRIIRSIVLPLTLLTGLLGYAMAADTPATAPTGAAASADMSPAHVATAHKLIDDGIKFLLSQREEDGGWSIGKGAAKPAATAMAVTALLGSGKYDNKSPEVKKGFEVLLTFRQPNGGLYNPKEGQENYTTAIALMALSAAKDPAYQSVIGDAIKYMKGLQIVPGSESPDGQKIDANHPFNGGVSYGRNGRPDLSNEGYWIEGLHEAGVPAGDEAMQRAILFVSHCQNWSETNSMPIAKAGSNDGGFFYAAAIRGGDPNGESMAEREGMGLRSYGSMTYTGFKSLLYAGVDRKDPRVQAALKWIAKYWRLDSNPNMPAARSQEGLFYYYHVFAKALHAWGEPVITDANGKKHNWREELTDALAQKAQKDGHWENDSPRWFEKDPILSTCYAVMSLEETLAPAGATPKP
jgi:squalene-hopene/tetraprenyl-beta-curcumene cyclase